MRLAELRLSVLPGRGLVARFPAAVFIVTSDDWSGLPAIDRLIEECAVEGHGQTLAQRLSALVGADEYKVPSFCAVADSDEGLSLFVHGDAQVVIMGARPGIQLSGGTSAEWTGGVEDHVASLAIGPVAADLPSIWADSHSDLRDGVVLGSAVLLTPRPAPIPVAAPPALVPETTSAQVDAPEPYVPTAAVHPPSVPAEVPVPAAAIDAEPPMVWGIHCKRGHFNNPDARYCRMCGTHMVHQRRDPVLGPRPILGFLVVDDGSTFKLDADYVLGTDPGHDAGVRAGDARGVLLSDPEDAMSPVHARVQLDGWDAYVSDCDSHFGTHVWTPGSTGWVRLNGGEKHRLEPGTHVLLGRRSVVFDSLNRR